MDSKITMKVALPGGQDRLRQMVLYACKKNVEARYFGRVKLNKILWKSDFDAYAARLRPVTGRPYQRLPQGPAPKEMLPVYREMLQRQLIVEDQTDFGGGKVEMRPRALAQPDLSLFDDSDLQFVDQSIRYYWNMTGTETSDDSHGASWTSRNDGDPMPYESTFLSDNKLSARQVERLRRLADDRGLLSL